MELKGYSHKFGDDVNTDYIISGKYKFNTIDMDELSVHLMEDLRPNFYNEIKKGDFIVAGENFGCGSSREQAPLVIKHAGISAVIATSFARIFYRNSINIGLPLVEVPTDNIEEGDLLTVDLEKGVVKNLTKDEILKIKSLPKVMLKILQSGGLVNYYKKYGTLELME
ncbi:3-isopropylmalate dehydratase, small subunit [Petrotoga mobilis SJ95]|jgi:3-isopropylmalate/(R)-2-methylmalate dehydratase small subunit|uniref:3-isopropylmalate dehydratase small subunit n=1 Tax=Petrotoga mobilis (strain DSM 10674 / SJ95) TaxID=403833 RepID=A9BIA7_PETMO|nr:MULTISPECIES: 3-isopropylmalate dehydratase small subunit [Petrotoga]ABX32398.1 3-isopropylmalate dehydratase, small subunit [Petrotoga mobilis SJ95]PNR87717.1 3-isopropylmalate dehydratase small subunit [Petrotoga sp. 9T1HF07.CasAA.8.2]RLL86215.1 3-isopropylmalate dehydratase [Petrotoga sp. Shatin.DS.tank11.9.2.9.3]RLL88602.1 3-isopropylmalate dehydratase [Petrotoga sp. HKA.pet.4.5]